MRTWILALILIFFAVSAIALDVQPSPLESGFDTFSSEDGVPGPTIYAIIQDKNRFIWIGGENGLARWDGATFQLFPSESLVQPIVLDLLEAPDGKIWIGSFGGISVFDPVKNKFSSYLPPAQKEGVPASACWRLEWTERGTLLVATLGRGLLEFDPAGASWQEGGGFNGSSFPGKERVLALRYRKDGTCWVSTFGATGIYDFKTVTEVQLQKADGTRESFGASSFYTDDTGRLLASYNGGYAHWDETARCFKVVQDSIAVGNGYIWSMANDRWGRLWCASALGLFIFKNDALESHFVPDPNSTRGLAGLSVNRILADDAGGMVFGIQLGGLQRWDPWMQPIVGNRFSSGKFHEFSASSTVTAMAEHKGAIYFATSQNVIGVTEAGTTRLLSLQWPKDLSNRVVYSMAVDDKNRLWIAAGLFFYRVDLKTGVVTNIPLSDSPTPKNPASTYVTRFHANRIWLSSINQGMGRIVGEANPRIEWLKPLPTRLDGTSLSMEIFTPSFDGAAFWIGSGIGLISWNPLKSQGSGVLHPLVIEGVSSEKLHYINDLLEDSQGLVWVGCEAGLIRYDPAKKQARKIDLGFAEMDPGVKTLSLDKKGRLWGGTPFGWFVCDRSTGIVQRLSKLDGFVSDAAGLRGIISSNSGQLFMGGNRGFTALDPELYREDIRPVRPSLGSVVADGKSLAADAFLPAGQILIPPATRRIDLVINPFTFLKEQELVYRIKIEGFDPDFRTSTQNVVTYTNIPPGKYRMLIEIQMNGTIRAGDAQEWSLIVIPTFFQTSWFFIAIVLTCVGVGLLMARYRTVQIHRHNDELVAAIAIKTMEVNERNEELSAANAKLETIVRNLEDTQQKLFEAKKLAGRS